MVTVERYSPEKKEIWDQFVETSRNGLFIFYRNYMDYHRERFPDHSLIFFEESEVIALIPGTIINNTYHSPGGLTFGGIIIDNSMTTTKMMSVFNEMLTYFKRQNIQKMIYKCIPYIYTEIPSEEDRYALFLHNSQLIRRDITVSINLTAKPTYQKIRRRCIKKAEKTGICVRETNDFETYWKILTDCLFEHHETRPVHSLQEMLLLKSYFPKNIRLFGSFIGEKMLAGIIIYENKHVAHAQYIACNESGRDIGALDFLFAELIEKYYRGKKYFDFGISNENDGKYLNKGLIFYKEGFGARAVAHDFYQVNISDT